MQEAIQQVREELGPEAIIYQTRRLKKRGFWWMENQGGVEIMAGVEEKKPEFSSLIKEAAKKEVPFPDIQEEIRLKPAQKISNLPPNLEKKLLQRGVKREILLEMGAGLAAVDNYGLIKEKIQTKLPREKQIHPGEGFPRVVALFGPTGTGKTTAVAKLAGNFGRKRGLRVVLLNQDTKRLGAEEHFDMLARELGVESETIFSSGELTRAIEKYFDADLIFLDTAGCNPLQREELLQMKTIIRHDFIDERLLVLSINTRIEDLTDYRERFGEIGFSGFVFTRLDETQALGNIFNLVWGREESLCYLTSGQGVTDDIQALQPGKLVDEIFQ